jgi:hypothetical protein
MTSKEKLIKRIESIDDESVLKELIRIVDLELSFMNEQVELSKAQKDFVEEGVKEYKEGKIISHEEVKRRTKEWLRKNKMDLSGSSR